MNFKEIINMNAKKDELFLGVDLEKREYFKINIKDNPSLILTGETGIGKSRIVDQVLLQFVKKYTSLELTIVSIDTTGVELLTYVDSKFAPREGLINAINDLDKTKVAIARILDLIDKRKRMSKEELENENLIVVAIDDNKSLLNDEDLGNQIEYILKSIKDLKIFFILATNYVYNSFFEDDQNINASYLVTLDLSVSDEASNINIKDAANLPIGLIKVRKGNGKETARAKTYNNFDLSDKELDELINIYIK